MRSYLNSLDFFIKNYWVCDEDQNQLRLLYPPWRCIVLGKREVALLLLTTQNSFQACWLDCSTEKNYYSFIIVTLATTPRNNSSKLISESIEFFRYRRKENISTVWSNENILFGACKIVVATQMTVSIDHPKTNKQFEL